ncbi:MAG: hypothetical protein B7Z55_19500, partial [Planctomycetales bacterium 12-60-4]
MPKYAIVPNRVILVAGETVTPEDQIGTIDCDLSVHDVLAMVQFKNASLVEIEEEADSEPISQKPIRTKQRPKANAMPNPFASHSAKTQAALEKAGITTLTQAAL